MFFIKNTIMYMYSTSFFFFIQNKTCTGGISETYIHKNIKIYKK